jgi:hypothetical protein
MTWTSPNPFVNTAPRRHLSRKLHRSDIAVAGDHIVRTVRVDDHVAAANNLYAVL